jgi:peptidoglycan/LPS O-acetylase OafA/YrhL
MVALSHASVSWQGRNIGVMAVVIFFMLSGYVVAGLLRHEGALANSPIRFYVERAARLLPLYYAFVLVGAVIAAIGVITPALEGHGNVGQWIGNLTIIPLNYYMVFPELDRFQLIPPAWSLGLEVQFYLLAPWLLRSSRWMLVAMVVTGAIAAAAYLGQLHTDWFGYRLLFGNLYIFLSGAWLYRVHHEKASPAPLMLAWGFCFFLLLMTLLLGTWGTPYTFEVLASYLIGLPLLAWLGRQTRKSWDDHLGELAYGAFLSHFAILWTFQYVGWLTPPGRPLLIYLALVLAAALSGHLLIERPLLGWRRRLR